MVYVFGLNVPLLEILLVFLVLMTIGLAFILVELKKLKQLLTEEKNVVHQFEQDLASFEKDKGKVHHPQLETYVRNAMIRGMPPQQIEQVLKARGWNQNTVKKVLNSISP